MFSSFGLSSPSRHHRTPMNVYCFFLLLFFWCFGRCWWREICLLAHCIHTHTFIVAWRIAYRWTLPICVKYLFYTFFLHIYMHIFTHSLALSLHSSFYMKNVCVLGIWLLLSLFVLLAFSPEKIKYATEMRSRRIIISISTIIIGEVPRFYTWSNTTKTQNQKPN